MERKDLSELLSDSVTDGGDNMPTDALDTQNATADDNTVETENTEGESSAPEKDTRSGEDVSSDSMNNSGDKDKNKKGSVIAELYDYVGILIFSVLLTLTVFSFAARLCTVDGSSMKETLYHGERLIISDILYTPQTGDIIVFHQTGTLNEPVVKRVIATEGQTVKINYKENTVSVDGVVLDESEYIYYWDYGKMMQPGHSFNINNGVFEATVPEGHVFVMGDNRNNSTDSRSTAIGFVDQRRILGHVLMRISPFTVFN